MDIQLLSLGRSRGPTMSRHQIVVFQRVAAERLESVPPALWERFASGSLPLASDGSRRVDLLLLTLEDGFCTEADAISLELDENGYRRRFDVRLPPLPSAAGVFDARSAFMRRYLAHAHQWRPSAAMLQAALRQLAVDVDSPALP